MGWLLQEVTGLTLGGTEFWNGGRGATIVEFQDDGHDVIIVGRGDAAGYVTWEEVR